MQRQTAFAFEVRILFIKGTKCLVNIKHVGVSLN